MKRPAPFARAIPVVLLLLAPFSGAAAAPADTLTVLTYNILCGGEDCGTVTGRNHEWLRVIESRAPDVILIQEARGWHPDEEDLLAAAVDSLNRTLPGDPPYTGLIDSLAPSDAIITRLPALSFEAFRETAAGTDTVDLQGRFLRATLLAGADTLAFFSVHFAPWTDRTLRSRQSNALLALLDRLPPRRRVLIGGDFNSYSPEDTAAGSPVEPDYAHGALPPDLVGCEPVGRLLARGYEDAFRTLHPHDPGYTQHTDSLPPENARPVRRIDFLLRTPGLQWRAESAERLTGGYGPVGSDHYAVFARYVKEMPSAAPGGGPPRPSSLLLSARPNPAAGKTTIRFRLAEPSPVRIVLYDPAGRAVRTLLDGPAGAGAGRVEWDGRDDRGREVPPGVYFLRLALPGRSETARLVRVGRGGS